MRPAVFLDRDGVLIEDVPYLTDPALVRLAPGAGEALRRLRGAGFACVVVTNQSAIARGLLTEDGLSLIHERMSTLLAEAGAALDAIYYCPHGPASDDRTVVEHKDRKPGPGMLLRAAADHSLDLASSWMVGDMISDMLAGRNAGVRGTILVRNAARSQPGAEHPAVDHVVSSLPEAADVALRNAKRSGEPAR